MYRNDEFNGFADRTTGWSRSIKRSLSNFPRAEISFMA